MSLGSDESECEAGSQEASFFRGWAVVDLKRRRRVEGADLSLPSEEEFEELKRVAEEEARVKAERFRRAEDAVLNLYGVDPKVWGRFKEIVGREELNVLGEGLTSVLSMFVRKMDLVHRREARNPGLQKCGLVMMALREKGCTTSVHKTTLYSTIREVCGADPRTVEKYTNLLLDLGYIYYVSSDNFRVFPIDAIVKRPKIYLGI